MELKYTYLEENKQCPIVISSSLTTPQEMCILEVLKRCKKAIGLQISDLKGISPLACIIYPISDSPWVSPTQVCWRESGHPFYCFLDDYSEYFQIEIDVEDQEKTTFTCPFGTYTYRRMPFGLCNAPTTFQICMLSIFRDMVEQIMEVFMDDITIYGGIVLGHIIFEKGIEVDKAKVELIVKLPSPTTVKGVRQFLGHVGFYRRFIKDFSKLSKPLCELLAKDAKSVWDERCQKSFDQVKKFLTTAPIVRAPNWLIRWILLLQEFDLQIRDKKGVENVVADHLSSEWKAQDRKHFFAKIHAYYWEEPVLFKCCADQIIRKCVPEEEQQGILSHSHESACGGHFAS
ncbi:Retrovirus-related Pol polyprotein from transposon 17.6 [Vitis vinifera]|uniref:Retrovirus-related Pol polyprotein from transposon 17.6 n=1 Tax=Vitis vinifera TaxID=29760 RepID=A0A438CHN9_VITVI|nr:Retrovirus-related Pol polyprotein from transposon 17.6 [Vitis vinifera]